MSDFFSQVGDGLQAANNSTPDDTKTFADAIAARFGQGDNVLTARLLPPVLRMPNTPMANLSIHPLPSTADSTYIAVPPHALSQWLDDPRTLVVDIRPHAAYSSARLARAVSLSVPSTLLKRPLFSLQRLSAMLPSHSARTRFSAWRAAPQILVYDADSTALSDTSNIQGLLRKFRAEAPEAPTALAWVQGGFQAVWALRRDLVDAVPPTPETETETDDDDDHPDPARGVLRAHHLPRAAFALASTTQGPRSAGKSASRPFRSTHGIPAGPHLLNPAAVAHPTMYADSNANPHSNSTGAPSPAAAFNPFFDAVRQNAELSHGITERIPLRLPRRVRRRVSELPFQWLRDIARRAGPVTPPDALPSTSGTLGAYTGATTSGVGPYGAFRNQPNSSEDENESSDSSVGSTSAPGRRWGAPTPPFTPPSPQRVEEGTEALAMQFYRIELAEQRRMMGVMEHHSRESGVDASSSDSNANTKEENASTREERERGANANERGANANTNASGSGSGSGSRSGSGSKTSSTDSSTTSDSTDVNSLSTTSSGSSFETAFTSASTSGGRRRKRVEGSGSGSEGKGKGSGGKGIGIGKGGKGSGGGHGHGFPFSITAGVEKGSKNRYRNIWPFEHARVRLHRLHAGVTGVRAAVVSSPSPSPSPALGSGSGSGSASAQMQAQTQAQIQTQTQLGLGGKGKDTGKGKNKGGQVQVHAGAPSPLAHSSGSTGHSLSASVSASSQARVADVEKVVEKERVEALEEEHDDYVNASHVQPLGTRRRYIATQGPLEATFGDFWTLVWQQNIHVIVMLTREVEGAMVKCGSYWRPGTYGPLRVELLGCAADGCRGVCPLCSGEASAEGGAGGGFFANAAQMQQTQHSNRSPHHAYQHNPLSPHLHPSHGAHTTPPPPPPQLIKRTLRLTHAAHPGAPPRRVVQLQYLGWPDMNVPEDARGVLGIVWEVGRVVEEVGREAEARAANARTSSGEAMEQDQDEREEGAPGGGGVGSGEGTDESDGSGSESEVDGATGVLRRALRMGDAAAPVLLHCSAGVGRTGGFIAVDAVLDAVRQEAREMYAAGGPASAGSAGSAGSMRGGSEGIVGISAGMRASGISGGARAGRAEEEDRMEVDVEVEDADADADMHEGRGMRTPMQVDSAEIEMDMGETRRWAQRVADTKVQSLPSTAFPTSTSTALGPPFQFQPPASMHRTTFSLNLPTAHHSLPTAPSPNSHSQSPENKSASLPLNPVAVAAAAALPLSVRRGYADYRLRTFSAPTAAPAPPPPPQSTGSSPWLLPPERKVANSPVPSQVLPDRPLANSPLPDRPRSLSPFSAAELSHRNMHSLDGANVVADAGAQQPQQQQHVDYKEPRALHSQSGARPVRLSAFEDPIWKVVQDMREQRMSLCQSLRQYVFVHAAIIEGALMVVDEERARAGVAWRAPVPMVCRGGMSTRPGRPTLFLMPSDETQSTTSSTGKRLASPTELPKEDKKGEIVLSKRPSIKRKTASADEYTYTSPLATFPPP